MKNILIISAVFPPEPVVSANLMKDLAEELSKEYNVTVLCPIPTRPLGFNMEGTRAEMKFPFKVVELDSFTCAESKMVGRLKESNSFGKAAARYIKANHADIDAIHVTAWPLAAKYWISKVAKKYKIPFSNSVQDIYPESLAAHLPKGIISNLFNSILLPLDKYGLQKASIIHTISDKMVDYLSQTRKLDRNKFVVVRNWQNEEDFIAFHNSKQYDVLSVQEKPLTFMYMGNVGPLAGLDLVIDAFNDANLPNARLVIAGAGSAKESLQKKVRDLSIKNVEFWDVPQGKVPEIQDKADIMVLPIKKGFGKTSIPSKLPAYMFSKRPVLASVDKDSDTAECIINAKAGWVVEPEDTISLSKVFNVAAKESAEDLIRMGSNGFNFAMKNLSKATNLKKLTEAVKSLI